MCIHYFPAHEGVVHLHLYLLPCNYNNCSVRNLRKEILLEEILILHQRIIRLSFAQARKLA